MPQTVTHIEKAADKQRLQE